MSASSWEEAWRLARTSEQCRFLDREADRRGERQEALIGLLRSTYARGELAARESAGGAEIAGDAVTHPEAGDVDAFDATPSRIEPVVGEWWQ